MNPEPIAPAAPILVHSLDGEEDGYLQQRQEVEDRINIDICTTKHKSRTGLRLEKATDTTVKYSHRSEQNTGASAGNDRINIDFRTDIRPSYQQQRKSEPWLGEATAQRPEGPLQQESPHIQHDFQSAAGITLAELEKDLRYQCVKAEPDPCESRDQCSVSCARCYTHVIQLYSCHTFTRNLLQCQCGRFNDLVLNNKLRHAYVAGWAMLMSSVFPLAPNHIARMIWVLCQLVFFLGLLLALLLAVVLNGHTALTSKIAQLVFIAFVFLLAFLLACCDFLLTLFLRFSRPRNQQPPEAESLLHHNQQTRSCFKDWLYRYNDLLRLIVTEIVAYLILISTIVYSGCGLNIWLLVCSAVTFLVLVYASQLVVFVRLTVTLWKHLKPLPTTRDKAMWLLFRFLLNFVVYRIIQTQLLVTLYSIDIPIIPDCSAVPSWVVYASLTIILTYLTPIVGILTFLIMKHGWIHDLCIMYCTEYLSYLNTIQSSPNTGQETRQSIRAALSKFEYETLMQESKEYRKGNRWAVNSVYLFSPLMLLFSLPMMICLGTLTFILIQWFSNDWNYYGLSALIVVPFFIFVNHIHLMLVYLAWPVLLLGMFIYAMVRFLYEICCTFRGLYRK